MRHVSYYAGAALTDLLEPPRSPVRETAPTVGAERAVEKAREVRPSKNSTARPTQQHSPECQKQAAMALYHHGIASAESTARAFSLHPDWETA